MHTDKLATVHLIEILVQKGVNDFIISPGSRNAPLIKELVDRKDVNLYSIADERSAAFVAIGMYLKTRKAVAVICTSGSALLNYSPAVAEAFYQSVPLFVISADRPTVWLDQGEGQTIRQKEALKNFINCELSIPLDSQVADYKELDTLICSAIDKAFSPNPGPVHINIEYDEPLYLGTEFFNAEDLQLVKNNSIEKRDVDLVPYAQKISSSERVLVLCGQKLPDPKLSELLEKFTQNKQVVVLTETTSNLFSEHFIPSVDKTLMTMERSFEKFTPHILITLGDAVISKIIKRLLRKHKPKEHWHLSSTGLFRDTYQSLSDPLNVDPADFFDRVNQKVKSNDSDFSENWRGRYEKACELYDVFKKDLPFSDLFVFDYLLNTIEGGQNIHMANSSPIRYQQLFKNKKQITYCNRGTSGIDGSSSTALGFALKSDELSYLITGDVSFVYDSNAWWNAKTNNLKIILINNGGGGIFRIIPGPSTVPDFETYFETQNNIDFASLCKAFSISYDFAEDKEGLENGFKKLNESEGLALLEVKTKREINAVILNDFFALLRKEGT